jgi:hypothetical protein
MTDDDYGESFLVRGAGGPAGPRPTLDPNEQAAAYARRLLADQTPAQAEIARKIYGRLKAGADVDDVRDLIEQLGATRRGRRSAANPPSAGSGRPRVLRLYEDE